MRFKVCVLVSGFVTLLGCSQSGLSETTLFVGRNVYSPSVRYDEITQRYQMWYGGWQDNSDYPDDRIYYRSSNNLLSWSPPITVLQPTEVSLKAVHVNDPSVVTVINTKTKKIQYTMFYTVCIFPCKSYAYNQIWSSVSSDGIHWSFHKPLITQNGAAEPSVISNDDNKLGIWTVYYTNTNELDGQPRNVYMAIVDGDRVAISKNRLVFSYSLDAGVIANPEVARVGQEWNLFFNVYHRRGGGRRDTADIYVAKSQSNRSWMGAEAQSVILNDSTGVVCGAGAPGILSFKHSRRFVLFFGEAHFSRSGECDLSSFGSMKSADE